MSKSMLVCRTCAVTHAMRGEYLTAIIEIDVGTYAEIDTINLVTECPDCWDETLQ